MRAFIQLASAAVIARLLTPAEMGVFAVASAAVAISTALAEFGIHPYLVQRDTISREVVGRALALMMFINWTIAAALFFGRSFIGDFYGNAEIEGVIAVLALNFLLNPIGAIGMALLVRELRHGVYTILNLVAGATGAIVSVLLALDGYGPVALAFGSVAMKLALIIGILVIRPQHLTLMPVFHGMREIVGFGSWMVGATVIKSIGNRTPELIIGRSLGFDASGLYDRAATFTRLVNEQVAGSLSAVLTPFFAAERRSGADLRQRFMMRIRVTATIIWPFMIVLSAASYPLITTLFGDQWTKAAPLAAILAITSTLFMPFTVGQQLLLSHGQARKLFQIEVAVQTMRILAVVIAVRHGLMATAFALLVPALTHIALFGHGAGKIMRLSARDWGRIVLPALSVVVLTAIPTGLCVLFIGYRPVIAGPLALLIYAVAASVGWLAALLISRHPERHEILALIRRLLRLPPARGGAS